MTSIPRREEKGRDPGEGHVKTEAEDGVMCPQAGEHPEPLEAERGEEESYPRAFRGGLGLLIP